MPAKAKPKKKAPPQKKAPKKNVKKAQQKRESGMPGGGQGRQDKVGPTGVYPVSEMEGADEEARVHGQKSWGQGERGAEGYEDSGGSELPMAGELEGGGEEEGKRSRRRNGKARPLERPGSKGTAGTARGRGCGGARPGRLLPVLRTGGSAAPATGQSRSATDLGRRQTLTRQGRGATTPGQAARCVRGWISPQWIWNVPG